MSTSRTRNQQRRAAAAQPRQVQPVQNGQLKEPPTFNRGVLLPVITDIILCIALCIAKPIINKNTSIHLPMRTIPLLILAAVLAAVLIVVSYAIRQYNFLKNSYQNIEHSMEENVYLAQQIDFAEYPVNNIPYQQYPQYSGQQAYPVQAANQMPQHTPSGAARRIRSFFAKIFALMIVFFLMPLVYFMIAVHTNTDILSLKCVDAVITSSEETQIERTDEDGDSYYDTVYLITYEYTYEGIKYTGSAESDFSVSKGEKTSVYINPEGPNRSYYFKSDVKFVEVFIGVIAVFVFLPLIISIRAGRRRYRQTR